MLLLLLACPKPTAVPDAEGLLQPGQALLLPARRPSLGPLRTAHHVVAFEDFDCPFCARARPQLKQIGERGDTRVTVLNYPLEAECNPHLSSSPHPTACEAARAAACAHEQGLFWDYSDRLYADREARDPVALRLIADEVGADARAFDACVSSERSLATVERDTQTVQEGLTGVPTLFLMVEGHWMQVQAGDIADVLDRH